MEFPKLGSSTKKGGAVPGQRFAASVLAVLLDALNRFDPSFLPVSFKKFPPQFADPSQIDTVTKPGVMEESAIWHQVF